MDEPRKHPAYLALLLFAALGTAPFAFIGGEPRSILGLPLWLWSSMVFTLALSVLTAFGALRLWTDEDDD